MNIFQKGWEFITTEFNKGTDIFVNSSVSWLSNFAGKLIIAIIVFIIGKIIIKFFVNKWLIKILKRTKIDAEVHRFIQSAVKIALLVALILGVVNILGFQTTSLLALFGSATLAIGLSLQGSLSNFAGGLLLLVFKPFKQGDYIVVDGKEGYVESVSILYTKLKTLDSKGVMLPNGKLANSNIVNFHSEPIRRVDVEFDIPYSQNLKRAKEVLEAAMLKNEYIIKDDKDHQVKTVVKTLDSNGILLQNRSWVKPEDYWPAYFRMQEIIIEALEEANITIPYNQMDVHLSSSEDLVFKPKKDD